jgi:hypothetical protein
VNFKQKICLASRLEIASGRVRYGKREDAVRFGIVDKFGSPTVLGHIIVRGIKLKIPSNNERKTPNNIKIFPKTQKISKLDKTSTEAFFWAIFVSYFGGDFKGGFNMIQLKVSYELKLKLKEYKTAQNAQFFYSQKIYSYFII